VLYSRESPSVIVVDESSQTQPARAGFRRVCVTSSHLPSPCAEQVAPIDEQMARSVGGRRCRKSQRRNPALYILRRGRFHQHSTKRHVATLCSKRLMPLIQRAAKNTSGLAVASQIAKARPACQGGGIGACHARSDEEGAPYVRERECRHNAMPYPARRSEKRSFTPSPIDGALRMLRSEFLNAFQRCWRADSESTLALKSALDTRIRRGLMMIGKPESA